MANGMKRPKHTKGKVAAKRIWAVAEKYLLVGVFFCFFTFLAFVLIAYIVVCLEKGRLISPVSEWKYLWCWYRGIGKNRDAAGYIPTIFVASISLLLAVLTFMQSHYSRIQDRAMNFPKNYIDAVSIGLDVLPNMRLTRKYFDPLEAKTLIEFRFREGFSNYYKACPFRLFICMKSIASPGYDKWEELGIYNFRHSNLFSGQNAYEMLLEAGESVLLRRYCGKAEDNSDYRLKIVLDIRWTNRLTPRWCRMFSDVFIRQELEVDWNKIESNDEGSQNKNPGKNNKEGPLFDHTYGILYIEYSKAQIAAWILWVKCKLSAWRQEIVNKQVRKNQKTLEKRKQNHG